MSIGAYIDIVLAEAMEGLSEADQRIFLDVFYNRIPQRQDGKELYEWNEPVYNAIMHTVSRGLG